MREAHNTLGFGPSWQLFIGETPAVSEPFYIFFGA